MTYKERPKVVTMTNTKIRGTVASHLNTLNTVLEFRDWLDIKTERVRYGVEQKHYLLYEELLHSLGDAEDTKDLIWEAMEFYRTVPKNERGTVPQPYKKTGNADAPPTEKQIAFLKKLGYRESDGVIPDRKTAGYLISQLQGAQS